MSVTYARGKIKDENLKNLFEIDFKNKENTILIGPEGDFSEIERKEILSFNGVNKIKVNENILRSETAAISAISIINYALNL